MKKKISVIGIVGVPSSYGGFETLVDQLIESDVFDWDVYCSSHSYKTKTLKYKNANLIYIRLNANGWVSIIYDIFSIFHSVIIKKSKNLLVLGVSGAIIFPLIKAILPSVKIVTNIDGIEWKREKWSFFVKKFLKFSEKLAVKFSDLIIADNNGISEYIKDVYKINSITIAYGGDHALINKEGIHPEDKEKDTYDLSICRIEPENNIHIILQAYRETKIKLIFIGNWNNSRYGKNLFKKYSKFSNIILKDPLYDLQQLYKYRINCRYYIHGHSAGGTNPSLVEMMFFSKPIIAFDCQYNRFTMRDNGSFFKSKNDLKEIINLKTPLTSGYDLYNTAVENYTWNAIRKSYIDLFEIKVIE